VLHLGSNQGDRMSFLKRGLELIEEQVGQILTCSSIYETEAWGYKEQPAFFNMALKAKTLLSPFEVLTACQKIEADIGRNKNLHWGPRNIDIDVLYINDLVINTKRLLIPHPYLHIRNFVLYPLLEVDNERIHPIFGCSNQDLLNQSPDNLVVQKLNTTLTFD
jgi:2-amino-4-hydroxy-6-hydroxymethyldihydropteridine diphosphokinase